jgi:hypothetical protein
VNTGVTAAHHESGASTPGTRTDSQKVTGNTRHRHGTGGGNRHATMRTRMSDPT